MVVPREFAVTEVIYDADHALVFCQLDEIETIQKFTDDLQGLVPSLSAAAGTFVKGDPLVGLFDEDDLWYRCVVYDTTQDGVLICFVDYGNCQLIAHKDIAAKLRVPNEAILKQKTFAYAVNLNVAPEDISHMDRMTQNDEVNAIDNLITELTEGGAEWQLRSTGMEPAVSTTWRNGIVEVDCELFCVRNGEAQNFVQILAERNREFTNSAGSTEMVNGDGIVQSDVSENSSLAETAEKYLGLPDRRFTINPSYVDSGREEAVAFELDQSSETPMLWLQLVKDVNSCAEFMAKLQDAVSQLSPLRADEYSSQKIFLGKSSIEVK